MIDWTAALANLEAGCAAVFDTTRCTLMPRKAGLSGNHKADWDDLRIVFDFQGTIELEPPSTKLYRHVSADPSSHGDIVSYQAVLTANIDGPIKIGEEVAQGWPYRPLRDDFVVANDQTWKIAAIGQDGSVRPAYYLVKA